MAHEALNIAVSVVRLVVDHGAGQMYFVMRSSMLRGSRIKVGRVTLLRSAPGLSCEMMCPSTLP